MEDENEDDLIMYEESREIKETIWKVWDLLNDKEIVTKIILNSLLSNEIEKFKSNTLLNPKEDNTINKTNNDDNKSNIKIEKNGNYINHLFMLFINIDITINLEDIQYEYHLKIISYKIESAILLNKQVCQDKSNISENKSSENSYSGNKNTIEIYNNTTENNSNNKINTNKKNYINIIFTLQPNTLEGTKLLTITAIDYYEVFKDEQMKHITKSIFNNFEEILIKTVPLTKNCESIVIDANINIVFDFWATWKVADLEEGFVTDLKACGDPRLVGTKLDYIYFKKFRMTAVIEEVNSFTQEGNEDDNNEWIYKYKLIFQKNQSETVTYIFVSCENGTKTWVSSENDINAKLEIEKLQELSKNKIIILNATKNYIEKNKESLTNLYNKNANKK